MNDKFIRIICSIWVFLFSSTVVSAQFLEPLDYVKFEVVHALRIPHSCTSIELSTTYGSIDKPIKAVVKSSPASDNEKFEYSKIDTSYYIDKAKFYLIIDVVQKISASDIYSYRTMGEDGSTCKIEFGNFQNYVSYIVWTPNYRTEERKLGPFLNACRMIIELVQLNPDEIL